MNKVDEWQELLGRVSSQGCRDSFRKIFDHFFPILVGQGVKSGLKKEVASEVAQETLMKVWKQASSYDSSKGEPSLWIYIIARNLRYDYFRKLRNDPLNASAADVYYDIDGQDHKEDQFDMIFDLNQLSNHIDKLPKEQAHVIRRIYFEGVTQEELSEEDNIPLGTVKSRVRLAIKTLKQLIGGSII